jgi:hypothetical protein
MVFGGQPLAEPCERGIVHVASNGKLPYNQACFQSSTALLLWYQLQMWSLLLQQQRTRTKPTANQEH